MQAYRRDTKPRTAGRRLVHAAGLRQPSSLWPSRVCCRQSANLAVERPPNALEHDGFRARLLDEPQSLRKEVALVVSSELLAGNGERPARHSSRHEVDAFVSGPVEVADVLLDDVPVGSGQPKRLAGVRVYLDDRLVAEPSSIEGQGVP